MWGSYVGALAVFLYGFWTSFKYKALMVGWKDNTGEFLLQSLNSVTGFFGIYISDGVHVINGVGFDGAIALINVSALIGGFLIGWGIHSLFRRFN